MNKQSILFSIVGLLIGFVGGFMLANSINRRDVEQAAIGQTISSTPFINVQTNPQTQSADIKDSPVAMMPDVAEKLEKAKNEPDNFDAQTSAGDMYAQIGRFDRAAEFYERANKIRRADFKTIVKIGNAYFDLKNFETAEKWYRDALKINPEDVNVRTDFGLTFFLREPPDVDRAVREYQASLAKNPNHELTLQNLAAALREKADRAALQEILSRLEKVNPQNPVIPKYRAEFSSKN